MAASGTLQVDSSNPAVRRLVYSRYRDMLGTYHNQANTIVEKLPARMVTEDYGIGSRLESMIRQASSDAADEAGPKAHSAPGPAPPPPPPPGPGTLPVVRINTEIPDKRLEPPQCVQNAMMTKDKKPFTYTPGGLDLSQIRSPRMARRIVRNANAEGVTNESRPSQLAQQPIGPLPPSALAAMQPQIQVQVFPTGPPAPTPPPPQQSGETTQRAQPAQQKQPQSQNNFVRPDIKSIIPTNPIAMLRQTHGPHRPQVELAEQPRPPSPAIQSPPVQNSSAKLGSIYIPPVGQAATPESTPQSAQSPPSLSKAPTPWMHQQRNTQQDLPPWINRDVVQSPPVQNQKYTQQQNTPPPLPGGARIIPMQIEGREPCGPAARVISIQMDGASPVSPGQHQHPAYVQQQSPLPEHDPRALQQQLSWGSGGPNQSRSFRVLQKITDTSNDEDLPYEEAPAELQRPHYSRPLAAEDARKVPADQMRKMQLCEDDRALMNKFKTQVNEESSLHSEEDPRYRGSAIPSKAFRMLQTMTGSGPLPPNTNVARGPAGATRVHPQQQRSIPVLQEDETPAQPYIPASEQQVVEPRKYTGGSIPSRSFRMLQAMTAPENYANTTTPPESSDPSVYGTAQWNFYDPYYAPDPYWGYYPYHYPENSQNYNGPPISDAAVEYGGYWPPYPYYGYYGYPPYPMHPGYYYEDDCSGYSSNDEIAQYGHGPPSDPQSQTPRIVVTPTSTERLVAATEENPVDSIESQSESSSNSDSADSDTEVDEPNSLPAIKSVSDISVYDTDNKDEADVEDENCSDNHITEEECDVEDGTSAADEYMVPHQLSVIFEESDAGELDFPRRRTRKDSTATSVSDCSTTIAIGTEESDDDDDANTVSSTVTVRLPLKLHFNRSDNNEKITTVTVGDSEVDPDPADDSDSVSVTLSYPSRCESRADRWLLEPGELTSSRTSTSDVGKSTEQMYEQDSDSEVSVSVSLPIKPKVSNNSINLDKVAQNEDLGSQITEQTTKSLNAFSNDKYESFASKMLDISQELGDDSDDGSSDSSSSASEDSSDSSSSSEYSSLEQMESNTEQVQPNIMNQDFEDIPEFQVKEEVIFSPNTASNTSISVEDAVGTETSEPNAKVSVRDRISAFEDVASANRKSESRKNSLRRNSSKSQEESEEEADSGVTSDMSRHISETDTESECFSELRKMTRYQRAATHSRLFKLLQGECGNNSGDECDDLPPIKPSKKVHNVSISRRNNAVENNEETISVRRERLSLPLNQHSSDPDSLSSSSGLTSPASPNERLVGELVQSLLQRKKGRCLRRLPMEKLHAAALRILQEDMDPYDTVSSSEDGTADSTPARTPQNYYDYCNYYDTWRHEDADYPENFDILPSKAFKQLQTKGANSPKGFWAKCPRVLSSKNIHKDPVPAVGSSTPCELPQRPSTPAVLSRTEQSSAKAT